MVRAEVQGFHELGFEEIPLRPRSDWEELVAASNQGTVYHGAPWLEAVARLSADKVALYGAFREGKLVAGVPLLTRRRGVLEFAQRAFATPYGNVMVHPGLDAALFPNLLAAAQRLARRFSLTTLTASPFAEPIESRLGWQAIPRATFLLRSSSLKGLWRSMASEVRNRIRKAEKAGISITTEQCAPGFFEIYHEVFQRQGARVEFTGTAFDRFLSEVQENGIGKVYVARAPDSTLCAACLVVHDRNRAYYSLAASHPELRKTGAPSLLVWEILRDVLQTRDEFDFGGANVPHVSQFKSKFRGRLVSYSEFIHHRSPWERVLIDCVRRVRSVHAALNRE